MDAECPTVLLVDDDAPSARVLAHMLREDGYQVETAPDGATAIARLSHGTRPSIVVVDYRLPHADGLSVASFARSRFPGVPIIVVTGWPEVVAGSGVALDPKPPVFAKPVDYHQLSAEIARMTRTHPGT